MKILEQLKTLTADLFKTPLGELKALQIFVLILLGIAAFYILKWLFKTIGNGFKKIGGKAKKKLSYKEKCKNVTCRHCGRTLDKCQCQKNQGRGYFYRYRHYKKETKQ